MQLAEAQGGRGKLCHLQDSHSISTLTAGAFCIFFPPLFCLPQIPPEEWATLREQLLTALLGSTRSSKPSIFGAVAEADTSTLGCGRAAVLLWQMACAFAGAAALWLWP